MYKRQAFDIEGMGNEIVKLFIEKGLLENFNDIFNLSSHSETIKEFDGFGTKSCHKLIQAIEVAKNISFERLLYALGIDEVGEATSKALARAFEYPEALASASFKSLIEIDDIGPKVASNILDYFADNFQKNEFLNLGRILNIAFPKSITSNALSGQTFVITGSFENYGRDEIKALLEQSGAKVSSSISKKTNVLLVGANPGSKLAKADALGVTVYNENDLVKLLKDG